MYVRRAKNRRWTFLIIKFQVVPLLITKYRINNVKREDKIIFEFLQTCLFAVIWEEFSLFKLRNVTSYKDFIFSSLLSSFIWSLHCRWVNTVLAVFERFHAISAACFRRIWKNVKIVTWYFSSYLCWFYLLIFCFIDVIFPFSTLTKPLEWRQFERKI